MADQKITDLTALVSVDGGDLLVIVDDPGGTPITKKVTVTDLLAAASGGGGLVLLEQHTASNSASLDFTSGITSAYDHYVLKFVGILNATNTQDLQVRFSTDGGSTWIATGIFYYSWLYSNNTGGNGVASTGGGAANQFALLNSLDNGDNGGANGSLELFNPLGGQARKAVTWTITAPLAADHRVATGGGVAVTTSAINAIQVRFASGNITSGTCRLYGYEK